MKTRFVSRSILRAGVIQLLLLTALTAEAAGTFRFLTIELPEGTTSGPYAAHLLTANATGPVEFVLDEGSGDPLPAGLTLNKFTGEITGQPTAAGDSHLVIEASDGSTTIIQDINPFRINNSGGSGDAFVSTDSLSDARVGVAYSATLAHSGGTGPFVWGVQDLPAGLVFNAASGDISGTPTVAGSFRITLTLRDKGDTKTVFKTLHLTILPQDPLALYNFQFETVSLVNGEVGTAYSDTYVIADEEGTVTFSAMGLPEGLSLDALTGAVSGVPVLAGTYPVTITAADSAGSAISTNLTMVIVPSASSFFYWAYAGIPAAIVNQPYSQSPNVSVAAMNGTSVYYSVDHLPPGLSYNTSTGEITGTPTQIGIYPVTFTATDSATNPDEVLTLEMEFVVFPAGGGDANRLPNPLWASRLAAKVVAGSDNDSWAASYIYNDDRTSVNVFNPAIDDFEISLGSSDVSLPAGMMTMDVAGNFSYTSPTGARPIVRIKGSTSTQTLSVSVAGAEIGVVPPTALVNNDLVLGTTRYRLKVALASKGQFTPTASYRNTSFVVSKGSLVENTGLNLAMFLADPAIAVVQGDTVILNLYKGSTMLLSKDVTNMVTVTPKPDKSGKMTYAIAKAKTADPSLQNIFSKMAYASSKGTLGFSLTGLVLAVPLSSVQEHLTVELIIGNTTYTTAVTFFETVAGSHSYTTAVTAAGSPY